MGQQLSRPEPHKHAMHQIKAAETRALRSLRAEVEGRPEFLDDEEALWRVRLESRDPAFGPPPPNMKPETRQRRAEHRAKLSAASRVRDRSEIDLCRGTGKYLGVACPGCRECGEGDGQGW